MSVELTTPEAGAVMSTVDLNSAISIPDAYYAADYTPVDELRDFN
jgi:hypothetical protein